MIPLRLKIETNAIDPYVVRLRSFEGVAHDTPTLSSFDAVLGNASGESADFSGGEGTLRVYGIDPSDVNGDVLFVVPRRGTAHRLIRANSRHNTLLVTERCDQLCLMCSQPPKAHHVDMFPFFETAVLLSPENATIGLSGGEPTLFKSELLEFLGRMLAARPDIDFHVLTNAQHFDRVDLAKLGELNLNRVLWGVPVYSSDPEVHDRIVAKPGAFDKVREGLSILCQAGAKIELRTVLMKPNALGLADLAKFVTTSLPFIDKWAIMQLENIGYGRQNWHSLFFDSSTGFDVVGKALDLAISRGIDAILYNFPLCTLPPNYRTLAPSTISDWKRTYLSECAGCVLRDDCGGFFEWHPKTHGYERFGLA
ncbi:His-Xaa-Ser system radical SAM maturase HxsC [Mesorhizobium sp. M8A.F.Ca.ET.208.01.1.1]|uniref:His-Xaa-Ser system radical SAM maturase HxsC n=1 Tax=unclassified Mesorhizobium TaxID=325217 RepID=UPI001093796A|nr:MULTISPECIES: His-Xaa-Ser system radical SAM maturase HxsC [unclassified Mesorhizobium]TGQ89027.1 His-Xaa-Ser system radical SAM maturase HxsC [Mesorhizobium sp. M8A.F.Ca.ET.208.01.1.1]TGR32131.1 His-Xaa-Ser system radical SAM maturase HxsC [Mesorhizobium sp. M8A.F.Ca.ET.202.01.1.1]TGT50346.1 His-Xaa-Ser system radical SAM maturase HxsC [Mesorhizobium sp. M8A.F.Ca.ET.167.01.1.1]TGU40008.1 His-Xaa-Ser system radical SAM maturase HxsC [bacterium M00.F.Ca.ET.156.01.1.1]